MEIKHGVLPNRYDKRDYSHERTFGAVDLKVLPDNYNADLGLWFPDQEEDGLPNGCTGYTQTATAANENGEWYDPRYTYEQTLTIANLPPNSPCQLRDSFKETRTFGVKRKDGTTFIRGAYFDVDKVGDYFDGARNALWLNQFNKRTLSCASPWFREWLSPIKGILPAPSRYVWNSNTPGHNYEICGWKTIAGKPYLIIKPWIGKGYGDGGYAYVSRETFNKTMNISGTALYIQRDPTDADIKPIKLDILELSLSLWQRLLDLLKK